jgi:hypothetical protein
MTVFVGIRTLRPWPSFVTFMFSRPPISFPRSPTAIWLPLTGSHVQVTIWWTIIRVWCSIQPRAFIRFGVRVTSMGFRRFSLKAAWFSRSFSIWRVIRRTSLIVIGVRRLAFYSISMLLCNAPTYVRLLPSLSESLCSVLRGFTCGLLAYEGFPDLVTELRCFFLSRLFVSRFPRSFVLFPVGA